jgi:biopolymer transport protein ExbD
MLRLQRKALPQSKVPDASMADIAFLLIIFFLVSKSFYLDKTPVALPAAHDRVRVEIPAKGAVNIAVTARAEVRIDGLAVALGDVQNIAEAALARGTERTFVIRADKHLPYKHVDRILEQLRRARVKNIALETRSQGGGFRE